MKNTAFTSETELISQRPIDFILRNLVKLHKEAKMNYNNYKWDDKKEEEAIITSQCISNYLSRYIIARNLRRELSILSKAKDSKALIKVMNELFENMIELLADLHWHKGLDLDKRQRYTSFFQNSFSKLTRKYENLVKFPFYKKDYSGSLVKLIEEIALFEYYLLNRQYAIVDRLIKEYQNAGL